MSDPMSLPEFNRWLAGLANSDRSGWRREFRQCAHHLRRKHVRRLRRHVTPGLQPWAPVAGKPLAKVGETAPMLVTDLGFGRVMHTSRGSAKVVVRKIYNRRDKARAKAFRKMFGPPLKRVKAVYRRVAQDTKRAAVRVMDHLKSIRKAVRIGRTWMTYGWRQGTRWVETLHFGGRLGRASVPAREIVGLERGDLAACRGIFADGLLRRAMKGK